MSGKDTTTLPAKFQISIPKGTRILLVPIPSREDLIGISCDSIATSAG